MSKARTLAATATGKADVAALNALAAIVDTKAAAADLASLVDVVNTKAPIEDPVFTGTPKVGENVIWHAGNDGDGSGLDADKWKGASYTASTSPANNGAMANGDFHFQHEA